MHILIIPSEEYIPKNNPIAGIFQHDQAKILKANGYKVGVLSFSFKHSFRSLINVFLGKKIKSTKGLTIFDSFKILVFKLFIPFKSSINHESIDNINIIRCDGFLGFKKKIEAKEFLNLWMEYGLYAFNIYVEKYGKPDIIHTHNMMYAGLLGTYLKKQFNIPIILTEHSSQYAMTKDLDQIKSIVANAFLQYDKLTAVSPKLILLLNEKFEKTKNNIKWLPNVIDHNFESLPIKQKKQNNKYTILNVANLIPLKGQVELIKAFNLARKEIPNLYLKIAGEGYLKDKLQSTIDELGLNTQIELIGLIDRNEVLNQMDNADLFVLPSHYETFGVVLIESLSRGIPVVSTYCGGPECIVDNKNGILVEPKNINQLAKALIKIYNNRDKYNKHELRKNTLSEFGSVSFFNKIEQIYKDIIN